MHPIALTVRRPHCWLLCSGASGSVPTAGLPDFDKRLLQLGAVVLVHTSAGPGDAELHRTFAARCREVAVQPVDQREIERDVWRGVVEVVRITSGAVGFKPLHLFRSPPWWCSVFAPVPEGAARVWLPTAETADAVMTHWRAELAQRAA